MVLSKKEIKDAMAKGGLVIDPFDEALLTPNGYQLTAGRVTVPSLHWSVRSGFAAVAKQTAFQVLTREHITLGQGLTAFLTLSSELSSHGVLASFPRLDAGYQGKVQLSAYNSSARTLDIDTGKVIAELVFEAVSGSEAAEPAKEAARPAPAPLAATTETAPLGTRIDPRDGGTPCKRHACTACCHDTEMPLTNEDRDRIEADGYADFWVEDGDWFTLKNLDGKCVFLQDDGKCKVYQDRPTGCRFYPAVWSMEDNCPVMDHECPHSDEFFITETLGKDLKNLVDTVQRERKQRRFRKGAL